MTYAPEYYGTNVIVASPVQVQGTISVNVSSTERVSIDCNESLALISPVVVIETLRKVDVSSISTSDILKADTIASFLLPAASTERERVLNISVRDSATNRVLAERLLDVQYASQGD